MYWVCRTLLFVLLAASISTKSAAAERQVARDQRDVDSQLEYLAGSYRLVGKEPGTNHTFLGEVIMTKRGDRLQILRTIGGVTVRGNGRIEPLAKSGDLKVVTCLRVRLKTAKGNFEGTYLYRSDGDNYARISGYFYQIDPRSGRPLATAGPGLEAMFPEGPLSQ